jgi:preprotein translocase subunit SecG
MLYNIIVGIIAIICFLLIVVVLLQPGQGGGISGMGGGGALGGGGGGLGARRTADLLSKSTSILAAIFLALCVLANFAIDRGQVNESILQQGAGVNAPIESPSQTAPAIPQQQGNTEDATEGDSEN